MPSAHMLDNSLFCLGTGISIKTCGARLVLWAQQSALSEMIRPCTHFQTCE